MNKLKVLFGITLLIVSFMFIGYPRLIAYEGGGGGTIYVTPTAVAPATTTAVQQTTTTVSQTTQTRGYCGPRTTTVLSVYPTSCKSPSSCVENTYVQTDVTITLSGGSPQCYFSIGYTYYPDIRYKYVYYTGTVSGVGSHTMTYYGTHSAGTITSMAEAGSGVYYSTGTVTMIFSPKPNAAPVISAFTATPSSGIEPLAVTFSGSATDAEGDPLTYTLIFDTTDTTGNVTGTINVVLSALGTHTYGIGSHTARLIVKDATNTASIDTIVTASSSPNNAPVISAFTVIPSSGIEPLTVAFRGSATDAENDPLTYTLIFNTANTTANVTGTINSVLSLLASRVYYVGNYTVRLIVKDATHTTSLEAAVAVTANHAPVISAFTATPSFGLEPLTVNFNGAATDIDGNALTYTLIFDSTNTTANATGSISSIVSLLASHVYSTGAYNAELIVSDGIAEATATTGITVVSNIVPVITAFTATPLSGKEPLFVTFGGNATNADGDPLIYTLIFDTINTALNITGNINDVFSVLGTNTYSAGTYTAELIVSDGIDQASATATITVALNGTPVIDTFTATPMSGREPLFVSFDGNATDADGDSLTYTIIYDISDTTLNATGPISAVLATLGSNIYAAGNHTARLIVTDGINEVATDRLIEVSQETTPIIDTFTAGPTSGDMPLLVIFSGSATDADGDSLTYTLVFNNNSRADNVTYTITGTVAELGNYTYTAAGTYAAELIVSDGKTEVTSAITIIVTAPNVPPVAVLTANASSGIISFDVSFDGSSSSDADGTITGYSWKVTEPDGTVYYDNGTGAPAGLIYTFNKSGLFTASLTVFDDHGASNTADLIITAFDINLAIHDFTPGTGSGTAPQSVNFTVNFTGQLPVNYTLFCDITNRSWNLTGELNSPVASIGPCIYTVPGNYTAQIDLVNQFTNASMTFTIVVSAPLHVTPGGTSSGFVLGPATPVLGPTTSGTTILGFNAAYALSGERTYRYDNTTNTTTITFRIVNLASINRTLLIRDVIPKGMAATFADVQVIPVPTTIFNMDPDIGWKATLAPQQAFEVKYIFKRYIPFDAFRSLPLPAITELTVIGGVPAVEKNVSPTTGTTITGLVIGALGNPFIGGVIVLIIIAVLFFTQTETGREKWEQATTKARNGLAVIAEELREPEPERTERIGRLVKKKK